MSVLSGAEDDARDIPEAGLPEAPPEHNSEKGGASNKKDASMTGSGTGDSRKRRMKKVLDDSSRSLFEEGPDGGHRG